MPSELPISAEAKGQLRIWATKAERRSEAIRIAAESAAVAEDVYDWICRRGVRRHAARTRLNQRLSRLGVQSIRREGDALLWRFVEWRDQSLYLDPVEGSELQGGALLRYLVCGGHGDALTSGLWALEVSQHTLGRALQRNRGVDLDALLINAHDNVLSLDAAIVQRHRDAMQTGDPHPQFRVPASSGVLACEFVLGIDREGEESLHVRARNWLHLDQLSELQAAQIAPAGLPGGRLGDLFLRPAPLRANTGRIPQ
jgi:hypothetical protein